MAIRLDPDGIEPALLHKLVDFTGKSVLEIGCGEGRVTWQYTGKAARVTAIDPDEEDIEIALKERPDHLAEKVNFIATGIEDFEGPLDGAAYDIVFFTRSL